MQVRIAGVFSLIDDVTHIPQPVRCGSIDFFCRGDAALCKQEWADFEAAATSGRCVAVALRLWATVDAAVDPPGSDTHIVNPYDPTMGVATIPCRPEPPSAERPDLSVACSLDRPADAGPPDAARPEPNPPSPPRDAAPSSPDATSPDPKPTDPKPTAPVMAKRTGCAVGGGEGGLLLALLALGRLRRRR
jgi:hypothetical protein